MNTLLLISFQTGDSSAPYFDIPVVLQSDHNISTIKNQIIYDMEKCDTDYNEIVYNSLSACHLKWKWFDRSCVINRFSILRIDE